MSHSGRRCPERPHDRLRWCPQTKEVEVSGRELAREQGGAPPFAARRRRIAGSRGPSALEQPMAPPRPAGPRPRSRPPGNASMR